LWRRGPRSSGARLVGAVLVALAGGGPSCTVLAMECPPPGYDGNQDCGYECGEGGTCCGNPRYYGGSILGTWYPDPRCTAAKITPPAATPPRPR
jgi:hypothetical protein